MEELLRGFPAQVEIPVAWGEQDPFGHVNAIIYFRYFETARIDYLMRAGFWARMHETGVGPIVASAECRFRIPVTFPDTVVSAARVKSINGEDRFTMEHIVVSKAQGKIAAQGECLLVTYSHHVKGQDAHARRVAPEHRPAGELVRATSVPLPPATIRALRPPQSPRARAERSGSAGSQRGMCGTP